MSNQCDNISIDVELKDLPIAIEEETEIEPSTISVEAEAGLPPIKCGTNVLDDNGEVTKTWDSRTKQDKLSDEQLQNLNDVSNKANQSDLEAEIKVRQDADTNTLASANSFTTSQVSALNEQLKLYGVALDIVQDETLYKYTFQLKNNEGNVLSEQAIDLPIESVVVGGSYNADTQSVVLTLQNGSTIEFPIGDIVQGLVSQTTFNQEVADRKQGDINTLSSAKSYTDTEVGKVDAKANANADAISKINDELPNKADNTRVDAIEMSVKDIVAPVVLEDTQGSDIFVKDTPSEDLFINTLGNTEQNGVPTPDNPIEVKSVTSPISAKSSGANLLDKENIEYHYQTGASDNNIPNDTGGRAVFSQLDNAKILYNLNHNIPFYISADILVKPSDNATNRRLNLAVRYENGSNDYRFNITNIDGNYHRVVGKVIPITNKGKATRFDFWLYDFSNASNLDYKVKDYMISTVDTSYVPYTEPSTTTYSITDINGITHEMNGIGGVHDAIVFKDDKYWLEKKFEKITFDGSEDEHMYSSRCGFEENGYYINISLKKKEKNDPSQQHCKSNILVPASFGSTYKGEKEGFGVGEQKVQLYSKQYNTKDISLWKQHLAQTPMEVVYELATPEYYELDQAEVLKMYAKTFNGGTNFTISSNGATPIMDFTVTILDCGQHKDVALKDASGNVVDVHTGSSSVWMSDKKKSLKNWAGDTDNSLTSVDTKATRAMQVATNALPKANIKNEHNDSTDMVYSSKQTNNEIIDAFKYNFRQLIDNTNLAKTKSFSGDLTLTNNSNGTIIIKGTPINNTDCRINLSPIPLNKTHKYYYASNAVGINTVKYTQFQFKVNGSNDRYVNEPYAGGLIFTDYDSINQWYVVVRNTDVANITISPILIDLTDMFGAGNEPSTVEELYQYIIKDKYYPHGRNIEPKMYCTKADVNKLSMCPSDTSINIKPTNGELPFTYVAPHNGQFYVGINQKRTTESYDLADAHIKWHDRRLPLAPIKAWSTILRVVSAIVNVKKGDVITVNKSGRETFQEVIFECTFTYSKELTI